MSYQIIRAGSRYDPIVVVSPHGSGPETQDATFHIRRGWKVGEQEPGIFHEISRDSAMMAFSGHADGWGWAERPEQPFHSLDEIEAWLKTKVK